MGFHKTFMVSSREMVNGVGRLPILGVWVRCRGGFPSVMLAGGRRLVQLIAGVAGFDHRCVSDVGLAGVELVAIAEMGSQVTRAG